MVFFTDLILFLTDLIADLITFFLSRVLGEILTVVALERLLLLFEL